jgi:hypothetical protein
MNRLLNFYALYTAVRFEGNLSLFFMQDFVYIDLAKEHSKSLRHEVTEETQRCKLCSLNRNDKYREESALWSPLPFPFTIPATPLILTFATCVYVCCNPINCHFLIKTLLLGKQVQLIKEDSRKDWDQTKKKGLMTCIHLI